MFGRKPINLDFLTEKEVEALGKDHMGELRKRLDNEKEAILKVMDLARNKNEDDPLEGVKELAKLSTKSVTQFITEPERYQLMKERELSFAQASLPLSIINSKKQVLVAMVGMGVLTAEELIKLGEGELKKLNNFSLTLPVSPKDSKEIRKMRATAMILNIAEGANALYHDDGTGDAIIFAGAIEELKALSSNSIPAALLEAAILKPGIWRGTEAPIAVTLSKHANILSPETLGILLENALRSKKEQVYKAILESSELLKKLPTNILQEALLDFVCMNQVSTVATILTTATAELFTEKTLGEAYYQSVIQFSTAVVIILNRHYLPKIPREDIERAQSDLAAEVAAIQKIMDRSLAFRKSVVMEMENEIEEEGFAALHQRKPSLRPAIITGLSQLSLDTSRGRGEPETQSPSAKRSPTMLGVPSACSTPITAGPAAGLHRNSSMSTHSQRSSASNSLLFLNAVNTPSDESFTSHSSENLASPTNAPSTSGLQIPALRRVRGDSMPSSSARPGGFIKEKN